MASPGNRHCANYIGTLSFPVETLKVCAETQQHGGPLLWKFARGARGLRSSPLLWNEDLWYCMASRRDRSNRRNDVVSNVTVVRAPRTSCCCQHDTKVWPNPRSLLSAAFVRVTVGSRFDLRQCGLLSLKQEYKQVRREAETRSSAIAEGPRDASCQLKSCQLPRNSAETTCTTSPEPSISCR